MTTASTASTGGPSVQVTLTVDPPAYLSERTENFTPGWVPANAFFSAARTSRAVSVVLTYSVMGGAFLPGRGGSPGVFILHSCNDC